MPCSFAKAALHVGVEHDQRHVVGPPVADRDGRADQRVRRLEPRLDVRRRHVLAGRVDDQLLLAVDDLHVAVVVDLRDVAACAASRRRRAPRASSPGRRGSRVITMSPRTSSSPSSASFSSTPGSGGPQVPTLIASGGLIVAQRRGLRHAPQLADRQAERREVARAPRPAWAPRRPPATCTSSSPSFCADRRLRLLRQRGRVGHALRLQRRLELLPDARDRSPRRGPHLGQGLHDRARVGEAGDREAEHHQRLVLHRPAVRDVRGRAGRR